MIILFALLIILSFIIIIIDVILYDYDVTYRVHRVLQYLVYFLLIAIIITAVIGCLSDSNNNIDKSTRVVPIVTPILMPIR